MVTHRERQIRSERLRDYFDLQLRFALKVADIASLSLADTVAQYTNFHRRFGLGRLHSPPRSAEWSRYIDQLSRLHTHEQRMAWTQTFFLQSPEESPPANQHHFGCFSCEPPNAEGLIRIHFVNRDNDGGTSSLKQTKIEKRKRELRDMFTFIKSAYPAAEGVRGGSWLYHLQAYRRLFPLQYAESRVILKQGIRFDGTSSWGQCLDHQAYIRADLRDMFLQNLNHLDMDHLWQAFPLPALGTSAPIHIFYDFYDVEVPGIGGASPLASS